MADGNVTSTSNMTQEAILCLCAIWHKALFYESGYAKDFIIGITLALGANPVEQVFHLVAPQLRLIFNVALFCKVGND
jgi:hypothetical protein